MLIIFKTVFYIYHAEIQFSVENIREFQNHVSSFWLPISEKKIKVSKSRFPFLVTNFRKNRILKSRLLFLSTDFQKKISVSKSRFPFLVANFRKKSEFQNHVCYFYLPIFEKKSEFQNHSFHFLACLKICEIINQTFQN